VIIVNIPKFGDVFHDFSKTQKLNDGFGHDYLGSIEDEYEEYYWNIINILRDIMNNNQNLYRSMKIHDIKRFIQEIQRFGMSRFNNRLIGLGTSWSWDMHCAFPYYGNGPFTVLLIGDPDKNSIDIYNTLLNNFEWKMEECEITLLEGSTVVINEILVSVEDLTPKMSIPWKMIERPVKGYKWTMVTIDYPIIVKV
jgi:hypothetical protein